MTGYTKLFGSIVASTIWREPNETRIVWITMLAMANKSGVVEASVPGLADMARVGIDACLGALAALEAPDVYSRTKEFEGRRIEPCDGGWYILNHSKYRAKMGADERREYLRLKQQEARDRKKAAPPPTTPPPAPPKPKRERASTRRQQSSTVVNTRSDSSTASTHADADADAETTTAVEAACGVHRQFVSDWMVYYAAKFKAEYAFQRGRDGKAVKNILAHFDSPAAAKEFIKACHKRIGEGYPFANTTTLADLGNNISKLQAALALAPRTNGQTNRNPSTPSDRNQQSANAGRAAEYNGVGRVQDGGSVQPRV